MSFMAGTEQRGHNRRRAQLRMLRGGRGADEGHLTDLSTPESEHMAARRAAAKAHARILVAGADPERRAAVLRELSEALPQDTQFGEARAAWEVLEQAPSSGVVMLAGDLAEVTAESLMHVLGHRHPSLPVVALGVVAGRGLPTPDRSARMASAVG